MSDYWDEEDIWFERVKEIFFCFLGLDFVIKYMLKEYFVMFNKLEQVVVQELWYKGCVVIGGDVVYVGVLILV